MKGHPGVLYIDSNEPEHIATALKPAQTVAYVEINTWGKADYYMVDPLENERMVERKQFSEALSDIDAVEEQLQRHLAECDELTLLIEGVALPTAAGAKTYKLHEKGMWVLDFEFKRSPNLWHRWNAFKYSLWHNQGVQVEEVSHWTGTCDFISTWYKKANDPTSTTLQRYIIPHVPPFDKNPHIDNLCRLKDVGIREVTAIKLIAELGTFHAVVTAPFSTLVGIMGGAWTRKFFETIGRIE